MQSLCWKSFCQQPSDFCSSSPLPVSPFPVSPFLPFVSAPTQHHQNNIMLSQTHRSSSAYNIPTLSRSSCFLSALSAALTASRSATHQQDQITSSQYTIFLLHF
ncbi:hypothetical protein Hanom_Chr13g01204921 [Helianthus anomalus]